MKRFSSLSTVRITRHIVFWLVAWLFLRYINYGLYINDNTQVINLLSIVAFGQTFILFYLFGYRVFPRYLYQFRFWQFSLFVLLAYYFVYLSSFLSIAYLQQISSKHGLETLSQVKKIWALIQPAGLLGCFTNSEVAFWNISDSFFYVTLILAGKLISDLLASRTHTLVIERDAVELERTNLTLERDNLTLELDLLKSQVNPHFLFNALNGIYARVVEVNEPAAELVLRLSELMRYNLYEANVENIPLTDEIVYLENYLSLEKIRHASLVDVIFSADDDFSGYQIAPLILIAFVENAFKHGLGSGSQAAYVMVNAELQDDTFYFTVQNSLSQQKRVAIDQETGGIGLANVKKRLALLYPDRYQLDVSQTPTSYTTILQLQLSSMQ